MLVEYAMKIWILLFGLGSLIPVGDAFAKRSKRQGFNFGSTMYYKSASFPDLSESKSRDAHSSFHEFRYRPFLGYSFGGVFNLGLGLEWEQLNSEKLESQPDSETSYTKVEDQDLTGGFLFGRLLFGRIFFMEAALGYYEKSHSQSLVYEQGPQSGSYNGARENWQLVARGPGAAMGAGMEIPVSDGFHLSASFMTRKLMLKQASASQNVGPYQGDSTTGSMNFGMSHYFD